jgi:DNA replication protein DnaC
MEPLDPKFKETIQKVFIKLAGNDGPYERRQTFLSFGHEEIMKQLFIECFTTYDFTTKELIWLSEYNDILEWLKDNKGKGLYLTGDCGRGKTDLILGVLVPLYMICFKKRLMGFHATRLSEKVSIQFEDRFKWNYEVVRSWKVAYIDELGTERMISDFGEKIEPFNEILNEAEQKLNILIISSNLTGEQFLERYGDRTMDRLKRLCKIISFKGNSLRS